MSNNVKIIKVTEPYLELNCGLGEGPHWEEKFNSLRFVDIVKRQVHYVNVTEGPKSLRTQQMDFSLGVTADIEGDDDRFVFGGKHGFGIVNRETGEWKYIKKAFSEDDINKGLENFFRANDGGVDPSGNFWCTYMNDMLVKSPFECEPEGFVLRLDSSLNTTKPLTGFAIPNGTRWSPSGTTFYLADSVTATIFAWDFDPSTSTVSNKRPFYKVPQDDGLPGNAVPDGFCVDTNGNVWIAVHGRGKVLQISPAGDLLTEIHFPTRCTTCPAFVGGDLYVTSMQDNGGGEGPEVDKSRRLAGSVFRVPDVGARGVTMFKFRPSVALPKV